MKHTKPFFCGFAAGVLVSFFVKPNRCGHAEEREVWRDTVVDTVRYRVPVAVDSVVLRYVDVRRPVKQVEPADHKADTAFVPDSAEVTIPITQKVYKDSLYTAYISGFMPSLDSLYVNKPSITQTTVKQRVERQKRWGLGLQAGIGVTPDKVQPYIGIGVSYNIIMW